MTSKAASIDRAMDYEDQTVAIVILNWNGGNDVLDCLESVFASTHKAIEVILVDNGSIDGSSDAIRARFPHVHFIVNSQNLGFAKGSNQGMEWALDRGIRYVLLLNGDARMGANTIHELLTVVARENDKVVACPRIYLNGSTNGAKRLWFAYGTVKLWAGLFQNPAFNQIDSPIWSEPRDMEYASGCCMLIPTQILPRVGMLDETFFAYCEDIDFSLRVRKAGFRLRYVPAALLWHGSSGQTDRTRTATYRYLSTRNNLWVVRKNGSMIDVLLCFCILPLRSLFRIARMVTTAQWKSIVAELRGIGDGMTSQTTTHR
ncbi:MAG: glycosyltransferase family 2 protein [Acidobacteriaceae bacterium]|nr:glycosyltransferase family 2 protein [Acidobacteriaceae bacterium]